MRQGWVGRVILPLATTPPGDIGPRHPEAAPDPPLPPNTHRPPTHHRPLAHLVPHFTAANPHLPEPPAPTMARRSGGSAITAGSLEN